MLCDSFVPALQFIFSTSTDGKIKAWLYDSLGARVDFDAPGYGYTALAYSADDKRFWATSLNTIGIICFLLTSYCSLTNADKLF